MGSMIIPMWYPLWATNSDKSLQFWSQCHTPVTQILFSFQMKLDKWVFQVLKILLSSLTHLIDLELYDHISVVSHLKENDYKRRILFQDTILGFINCQIFGYNSHRSSNNFTWNWNSIKIHFKYQFEPIGQQPNTKS